MVGKYFMCECNQKGMKDAEITKNNLNHGIWNLAYLAIHSYSDKSKLYYEF